MLAELAWEGLACRHGDWGRILVLALKASLPVPCRLHFAQHHLAIVLDAIAAAIGANVLYLLFKSIHTELTEMIPAHTNGLSGLNHYRDFGTPPIGYP
jgi:glycopeptide antibiotics resistance protein